MTSGATVRGTRQRTMGEILSVGAPGSSVVRNTTPYVPTMVTHTAVSVISRQPSVWTLISTLASSTMDPAAHNVRMLAIILLCAAICILSHHPRRTECTFCVCVCFFPYAAELPTSKTHYLQTNTIPMYEDDLFNQLGLANNEFSTPCESLFPLFLLVLF